MPVLFDWIMLCRGGAEIMATLAYFKDQASAPPLESKIGPPVSLMDGPCLRCWFFPRQEPQEHCRACAAILARAGDAGRIYRWHCFIWGHVNKPAQSIPADSRAVYVHGEGRFLLAMPRTQIKDWLQELLIYHGSDLKGLLQIFPFTGPRGNEGLHNILGRILHYDSTFPMDRLRVRFYARSYQIFNLAHRNDEKLTFDIQMFTHLLETAQIFRTLLRPDEQQILRQVLQITDTTQSNLAWGRLMGILTPQARDMMNSWDIRRWSASQIETLYELLPYVEFTA